jgi:hypothetical protein
MLYPFTQNRRWLSALEQRSILVDNIRASGTTDTPLLTGINYLQLFPVPEAINSNTEGAWFTIIYFVGVCNISDFNQLQLQTLNTTDLKVTGTGGSQDYGLSVQSVTPFEWKFYFKACCDEDFKTQSQTVAKSLIAIFQQHQMDLPASTWITPYPNGWRLHGANKSSPLQFDQYLLLLQHDCWQCYYVNNSITVQLGATQQYDAAAADEQRYLTLINANNIEPNLNQSPFRLSLNTNIDPEPSQQNNDSTDNCSEIQVPNIDYLNTQFDGFRRTLLDRIAVSAPNWQVNQTADTLNVALEALAVAADYQQYYQDAVASEAYLTTAQQRISVSRFSRMLDYAFGEGCNARTWINIEVDDAYRFIPLTITKHTQFIASQPSLKQKQTIYSTQGVKGIVNDESIVFEACYELACFTANNELFFYTGNQPEYQLAQNATQADLIIQHHEEQTHSHAQYHSAVLERFSIGRVLIFEQSIDARSGLTTTADARLRHAVRVSKAEVISLWCNKSQTVVRITWDLIDALPFPLVVNNVIGDVANTNMSTAFGNVLLADSGFTQTDSEIYATDHCSRSNLTLKKNDVAFARFSYDTSVSTSTMMINTNDVPLAQVVLVEDTDIWTAVQDIYDAGPMEKVFTVEIDSDAYAHIRFGDGINGKKPNSGTQFTAVYRIGNGTPGNIGRDTLRHIISDTLPAHSVISINNPLPASGAADPETLEHAKAMAQDYDKTQARCVTLSDFKARTESYNDIQQAAVHRRWTGSWFTYFIVVERTSGTDVTPCFADKLKRYIQEYALCGVALAVLPPRWVALRVALSVTLQENYQWASIKSQLQRKFDNEITSDHQGYFAPGRHAFGQAVYLSHIIKEGLTVVGVASLEATVFQRFGAVCNNVYNNVCNNVYNNSATNTIAEKIQINTDEIITVQNNPLQPSKGVITFELTQSLELTQPLELTP